MNENEVTYYDFVMRLYGLHKALESVLVFFTCNNNRAGRIALSSGDIAYLRYANKKGVEALSAMANIDHVRFRLEMLSAQLPKDASLPNTNTVIKQLLVYAEDISLDELQNIGQTTLTEPKKTGQMETPAASMTEKQKELIETNLIKIIGPMGSFLCKKHVHQANSFNQALEGLSSELSGEEVNTLKQMLSMIK